NSEFSRFATRDGNIMESVKNESTRVDSGTELKFKRFWISWA
ncbi:3986_t:CDS:1, partial [Rhizophagus irregularis]